MTPSLTVLSLIILLGTEIRGHRRRQKEEIKQQSQVPSGLPITDYNWVLGNFKLVTTCHTEANLYDHMVKQSANQQAG